MNLGSVVKGTPNWVLAVCATAILLALIGAFTVLAWGNKDTTDLRSLVSTALNVLTLLVSAGGLTLAGLAANKSSEAAENTNGKLQKTVSNAVHEAVPQAMANALNGDTEVKQNGGSTV